MKKILLKVFVVLTLLVKVEVGSGQWVAIPDTNFVNFLNTNGYSSCLSGNMLDTTCNSIVNAISINCKNYNIHNLFGIQFFDSLDTLDCHQNPLTIFPAIPYFLRYLNCSHDSLSSLPPLNDSLTYLNCDYNHTLTNLPSTLPDSLKYLSCYYTNLHNLPALPSGLIQLSCNANFLTSLPALPNTLTALNCASNQLTSLPVLPNSLTALTCSNNQLTSLPSLPNSLLGLVCEGNGLMSLPTLPNLLTYLNCNYDSLTYLPSLPNTLLTLEATGNQITSLPLLSNTVLTTLDCDYNQLTSLPTLPNTIGWLVCDFNMLTSLPALPSALDFFACDANQLTQLPTLPNSLTTLAASHNLLTSVPPIPNSCYQIALNNNQLTSLPELPDNIDLLYLENNPNLHCLPRLKHIQNLEFYNCGIQCLPNYGNVSSSNPLLSSIPICDVFNANGCPLYWNINGTVYSDSNLNCIKDSNEIGLPNLKLNLFSGGVLQQQDIIGSEGLFSFDTGLGTFTYTVDTTGLPIYVACPVSGFQTSVLTTVDSLDYFMDFGMQCKPGFDVGVFSIVRDSGIFRPGNFSRIRVGAGDISNFYGLHCASGVSGNVQIVLTGPINFVSATTGSLVPIVSGDTLTYNISDFGTINFNTDFGFTLQTNTAAQTNDSICISINATPTIGDNNLNNNSLSHCFYVLNSYDPNSKEVAPIGIVDSTQQWLTYTINFQNTGTAPAQHIYILDTLNTNLDAASFELLAYSHQPVTQVIGNVVRFNFPNINLPDSVSNEPDSHGYVQYRVKLKTGLALGTVIQNTADIVFDFNTPVVTNTVTNALQDCSLLQLATVALSNTSICKGDTLTASATLAFPMQTAWYVDSVFAGNGLSIVLNTLSAGNHTIQMTAINNVCTQTFTQTVFVDEPVKPTFSASGNLLTSSSTINNQWYLNGSSIAGAIQNTFTISLSGWYKVLVTDSLGCAAFSDSTYISALGIEELQAGNIFVSPNPFNTEFTVYSLQFAVGYSVKVYNVLGKEIFYSTNVKGNLKINTTSWAKGVYDLEITSDNGVVRKKEVKE